MWPDAFFFPHTVSVRKLQSSGGMGVKYAPAVSMSCEVKDEQTLVRDREGAEVVSSSNVTIPEGETVPMGSLVTVWPGESGEREAEVLAVAVNRNAAPLQSFTILSLR